MKFVLLPGMDGTGVLLKAVSYELSNFNIEVLPLPKDGPQDYKFLSSYVESKIGNEDFIIVAESFSGGVAAELSVRALPNLKGIIFVASFLSSPRKLLANFCSCLPIKQMINLPFADFFYRLLFAGNNAKSDQINSFRLAIKDVPGNILRERLKVIANYQYSGFKTSVPAAYIGASNDALVPADKVSEFKKAYSCITFSEIKGPHFILQAEPEAGAAAIIEAASFISEQPPVKA